MIAKIFGRSNPVNFILCGLLIIVAFSFSIYTNFSSEEKSVTVNEAIGVLLILLLSGFLIDFMSKKNKINRNDSYAILLFSLWLLLISDVFTDLSVVVSNLFILFAFRRLLSLQSQLQVKQKLFDASFWITISAFFEFWTILFLLAVYAAILIYASSKVKNWIVPLVGVIAGVVLVVLFDLMFELGVVTQILTKVDFGFEYLTSMFNSFSLGVFLSIYLLMLAQQLMQMSTYLATLQNLVKLIILWLMLGLVVYLLASDKHNGLLLYCFAPLSLIGSNFLTSLRKEWMLQVWVFLIFILAVISLFIK